MECLPPMSPPLPPPSGRVFQPVRLLPRSLPDRQSTAVGAALKITIPSVGRLSLLPKRESEEGNLAHAGTCRWDVQARLWLAPLTEFRERARDEGSQGWG